MSSDAVKTAGRIESRRVPRVLIVAYHFPPEASIGTHRTLRLVRRLVECGWAVTVLTGTEDTYAPASPMDNALRARVPPEVTVLRAPVLRPFARMSTLVVGRARAAAAAVPAGSSSEPRERTTEPLVLSWLRRSKQRMEGLARIPDPHVGWLLPAFAAGTAKSIGQRPDVIYSTAPPWTGQLVARMLASMLGCPWVADFRDPWARAPWREGRLSVARRAAEAFERTVVRRAEAIVFTTRTNLEEYAAFYGASAASKFRLVRNGCNRDEFDGVTPVARDDRFTMLHAGSLYGGRKPTALFNALAALRDRGVIDARTFCFRQIGRVALSGFDMAAERRRLGLDGMVELVPAQPRREILGEMLAASCLLLLQPGTTVSIPGKLFEYLATGRPVLALAEDGETSDLVRASGRGVAVLPDDQAAVERAIQTLVMNRQPVEAVPSADLFDGERRTEELLGVLESMCRPPFSTSRARESSPEI